MCSYSCLRTTAIFIGSLLLLCSVGAIGLALFLLFGRPWDERSGGTHSPNWEDVGPALAAGIVSLLVNVTLIGGAKQHAKNIVLLWIVWKCILIAAFWAWYGYNELKFHGYITFGANCEFCDTGDVESLVGMAGAGASIVLIAAVALVAAFHSKLKKRHRELTELSGYWDSQQGHELAHYQFIQPVHYKQ